MSAITKTGRLGSVKPSATTNVELYQPTANKKSVVTVRACNQGVSAATVRIALLQESAPTVSGPPQAQDYIVYDLPLAAAGSDGQSIQIAGIVLGNNGSNLAEAVWVYASTADVSFVCYGEEETLA